LVCGGAAKTVKDDESTAAAIPKDATNESRLLATWTPHAGPTRDRDAWHRDREPADC
jgi:hypothetical protein